MTPRGRPPKGGWPIVSWGHGTAGIADRCAPSRSSITATDYGKNTLRAALDGLPQGGLRGRADRLRGAGHPRRTIPISSAGPRRAACSTSFAPPEPWMCASAARVLIAGHSRAATPRSGPPARRRAGRLSFGSSAFRGSLRSARRPRSSPRASRSRDPAGSPPTPVCSSRALDTVVPALDVAAFWTEPALDLYPQTARGASAGSSRRDSFGSISVADIFRDDARRGPVGRPCRDVRRPEPAEASRRRARTARAPPTERSQSGLSDILVDDLREAGTKVIYRKYEGAEHSSVVQRSRRDALADARRRLR